jgi:Holliday junction resolvase
MLLLYPGELYRLLGASSSNPNPIVDMIACKHSWVIRFTSKLQVKKKIEQRVEPPDTFLEENHPMTIS